jgi:hypothetical protein
VLFNHLFFQYCYLNIGLFSIASWKVIAQSSLIYSLLLSFINLSIVIALPTIAIAIVVTLSRYYIRIVKKTLSLSRERAITK